MKQLNAKEAIALVESKEWEGWSDDNIVKFQLFQDRLCVPWDTFRGAVERVLGRPVWTHEFATSNIDNLRQEYLGEREAPSLIDIMELIPEEKRLIILP